jgi:hypothetical protein
MTQDDSRNTPQSPSGPGDAGKPELEHLDAAISHVDEQISSGSIAVSAAKGILYSLIETLGALVGDPDLPDHARSGYEGLLETARELRARLGSK